MSNYLPLIVRNALLKTDWSENEIAAYSALLEKGAMGLTDLSTETGISVSTLQYIIKKLTLKKMLTKNLVNGKPVYLVSDVDKLRKWVKGYTKQFETLQNTVSKFVEQYDFNPQMYTPKVRFYEGIKGVKQSYKKLIEECEEKEIKAIFGTEEGLNSNLQKFFKEEYIPARIAKGIKMKNIGLDSDEAHEYQKNDKKELRETRIMPRNLFMPSLDAEITLSGDKIHYMSCSSKKGAFALILKDESLTHIFDSIFDLLWGSCDKLQFYEGAQGIKNAYERTLENCSSDEMKSFYSINPNSRSAIEDYIIEKFVPQRVKKKIKSKNIALQNPVSVKYKEESKKNLAETRLVTSEHFPKQNMELCFFDDFIHFMSSANENREFSMILQDRGLSEMLNNLFSTVWKTSERCRFYEGTEGIMQSYRDMVEDCQGDKIHGFFSVVEDVRPDLQEFFLEEYVPERAGKGIHIDNIAFKSPKSIQYQKDDARDLRVTKLVTEDIFPRLNSEINLYDDCLHCMSFDKENAFAFIVKDKYMVAILKGLFKVAWRSLDTKEKDNLFMTDDANSLKKTTSSRKHLYKEDLNGKWSKLKPTVKGKASNRILEIAGHEVMSDFELPYMKKLAEIVTRNGGDILNVGYGLGLIDKEIENLRTQRKVKKHYVVELNESIAKEARKNKKLNVINDCWQNAIDSFRGKQFDGIIYDGYPLKIEHVHRDGINFIKRIVERNLLKENGILTFYVDSQQKLGTKFLDFLDKLELEVTQLEKVQIQLPKEGSQYWTANHFLAPVVKYKKSALTK